MRTPRSNAVVCLLLFVTPVAAWAIRPLPPNAALLKLAPEECVFLVHGFGFGKPDPNSDNKTEQLVADPDIQRLLVEIKNAVDRGLQKALEQEESDEERERIRVIFSMMSKLVFRPMTAYCAKLEPRGDEPAVELGFVFDLGDLEVEVNDELSKLTEKPMAEGEATQTTIGGVDCIELRSEGQPPAYWAIEDGLLCLTIGEDSFANLITQLSTETPAWLNPIAERTSVAQRMMIGYVNFDAFDRVIAASDDLDGIRAWKESGFEGLDYAAVGMGLEGTGLITRAVFSCSQLEGLFRVYDQEGLRQQDLARIPRTAQSATSLQMDLSQLFDILMEFMGKMNADAHDQIDVGLRQASAMLGIDIRNDFLGSLGDKWVIYETGDFAMIMVPDFVASVPLRDEAQARRSVDAIVQFASAALASQADVPISVKSAQFGVAQGYSVRGLPVALSFCVHDGELVVGLSGAAISKHLEYEPTVANSLLNQSNLAALLQRHDHPIMVSYSDVGATLQSVYPTLQMMVNLLSGQAAAQGIDIDPTALPPLSSITKYLEPSVVAVYRTEDGVEIEAREVLPRISASAGGAPVMAALLLPAVNAARAAARRTQSINNLRQLCLGVLNFESANARLPKADMNGLSWRVQILPYLEEQALYDQFHLDEPWDSEHNKQLIEKMPAVFASPASQAAVGKTNYLAVRGPDPVIAEAEATRFRQIKDGSSNTILAVEVDDELAVTWTKPDDFEWDTDNPASGLGKLHPGNVFLAVLADGHAVVISATADKDVLAAFFTKSGGEVVNEEDLAP